ncbi:MAG: LacI family DNA-binding transcriptional regulator [Candidatus Promineifilaceae bacterium]|nr:LacI family DNA-binding transcriptional regulator [Candidatus Promineifilaceae bacterium]
MSKPERVTIRDVARRAQVSHQTVSRVINGSQRVRPETRARVEDAIEALGYQPYAIARFMARGRTGTLACVAPNLTDYTFASIINGAEEEARRHDYFLLSASAGNEETFGALMNELVASGRTEGVIVLNPYADERHAHLPPSFPVVFAGARPREEAVSSVALADVEAARQATTHLLSLGHRRIGMITGPMAEDCSQDRSQGYEQALAAAGLEVDPALIAPGTWLAPSGYEAFRKLFGLAIPPTAIFAQNDQMAVGVLRAARDAGLALPDDLSVIGVDDIPLAAYFSPPLTTLRQEFAEIGRQAARLLVKQVEADGESSRHQHRRLPAELVIRRSTAPLPALAPAGDGAV